MDESILNSIKRIMGGLMEDSTDFNSDLITYINSSFVKVKQLGFGPDDFTITGSEELWSSFSDNPLVVNLVKTYVYVNVKLLFDPPSNSFTVDALKELEKEYAWRLTVLHDSLTEKE